MKIYVNFTCISKMISLCKICITLRDNLENETGLRYNVKEDADIKVIKQILERNRIKFDIYE